MKDEVLIKVENVSKKFCKDLKTSLWYGVKDLSSEFFGVNDKKALREKEFWAVKDISFELKRGECLGLIGHNGAGKSTLLKMLNGLIKPDKGKITMYGRVGALIELGAGFNPLLSGRENIFINGQILGFSRSEIERKFEEIIEFAEIKEFIDSPVRNYSSGMKVRLGFAVAAQMEPDILIIDEVLAVGDISFKAKCLDRIGKMLPLCTTIFVSHSMPMIARTTNRIALMGRGSTIIDTQNISLGIEKYYDEFEKGGSNKLVTGNGLIDLLEFRINESIVDSQISLPFKSRACFKVKLRVKKSVENYFISYAFIDSDTKIVANLFSSIEDVAFSSKGIVEIETVLENISLGSGKYKISISINEILPAGNRGVIYYHCTNIGSIQIVDVITAIAPVQFTGKWTEKILKSSENI